MNVFLCQQVRMIYQDFDMYKSPFTCHLKLSGSDRIEVKVLNTSDGWDVDNTKVKSFIHMIAMKLNNLI